MYHYFVRRTLMDIIIPSVADSSIVDHLELAYYLPCVGINDYPATVKPLVYVVTGQSCWYAHTHSAIPRSCDR